MYVILDRIKKGGRLITPANIEIECSEEQIKQLLKNKSIKEKKDGKGGKGKS